MENFTKKIVSVLEYYSSIMKEFGVDEMASQTISVEDVKYEALQNVVNQAPSKADALKTMSKITPTITPQRQVIEKNVNQEIFANNASVAISTFVPSKIDVSGVKTLEELKEILSQNKICEIQQFATNLVFGDGNPNAKILVIGEAPGQEEDEAGVPFVGRSGVLLMNALASVGLKRQEHFYVTNNIFWRPPGNRKPSEEEMALCKPFLQKMIEIIAPEVVICVGGVAGQNVLQTEETITAMRGKVFEGVFPKTMNFKTKVFCVYHPSYLLRNPSKKYEMYQDLVFMLPHISHLI